eukprot:1140914-Pelagomonas_calceolata.AAC.7
MLAEPGHACNRNVLVIAAWAEGRACLYLHTVQIVPLAQLGWKKERKGLRSCTCLRGQLS